MGTVEARINFTSLGMLILDQVHLPSGKVFENVIGGSGAYATLGARLFSPKEHSAEVGWAIRQGHDFPDETMRQLEDWGATLTIIQEDTSLSTRGQLKYLDSTFATKTFKYLTPTLNIEPEHLRDTHLLKSHAFHLFVDPTQVIEQTTKLQQLRSTSGITMKPVIVWEPKAYSCVPENLQAFVQAMQSVDVFSPNHIELASIVGKAVPHVPNEAFFEDLCAPFFRPPEDSRAAPQVGMLVVRAGDRGCFVKSHIEQQWLPAYYPPEEHVEAIARVSKVVDTTGAGNSFLGAFTIGLLMSSDAIFAACAGNVAASFVVEQVGLPTLSSSRSGTEMWNGEDVSARFQAYRAKVGHC